MDTLTLVVKAREGIAVVCRRASLLKASHYTTGKLGERGAGARLCESQAIRL